MPDMSTLVEPLVQGALDMWDWLMSNDSGLLTLFIVFFLAVLGITVMMGLVTNPPGK